MVSSAVTGMVQPVTKVAGSVGSQSGQDNSGNVDFARIMNSSVRNDVTGNSSKQTNTYSAAPSDSLVSMGANKSNKNADIVTTNSTVKNVKTDNAVKENSNKMTQDVQNAVSERSGCPEGASLSGEPSLLSGIGLRGGDTATSMHRGGLEPIYRRG